LLSGHLDREAESEDGGDEEDLAHMEVSRFERRHFNQGGAGVPKPLSPRLAVAG
jgi:hypothetical protein